MAQKSRLNSGKKTEENQQSQKRQPASPPHNRLNHVLRQVGNRAVQRALLHTGKAGMSGYGGQAIRGMPLAEKLQTQLSLRSHTATGDKVKAGQDVRSSKLSVQRADNGYAFDEEEYASYGGGDFNFGVDVNQTQDPYRDAEVNARIEDYINKGYDVSYPPEMQPDTKPQENNGGTTAYSGGGGGESKKSQEIPPADYFPSEQAYGKLKEAEAEGYEINYPPELEEW